jgi:hypothetical protein
MSRQAVIPFLVICFLLPVKDCYSFQQAVIKGNIKDSSGVPIEKVSVSISSLKTGTYTDSKGDYSVTVPKNDSDIALVYSCVGFRSETRFVRCDRNEIIINVVLSEYTDTIGEIIVSGERRTQDMTMTRIPVKDLKLFPAPSGSFEAVIKTLPGVSSNNELSSQYSVRGGNYDENLVYVNDVELYRPFLIRSGQQEGLSFINSDLVSTVSFSSGGFSASYGDKMSSVLDITYRNPVRNRGSVTLGLLMSSLHFEGLSKDSKFTWLAGIRYRSTRMMLKSLDSQGDYRPVFIDIQSLFRYKTGKNSSISLLAAYSSNIYNFIPQSRSSTFGTDAIAYNLYVLFNGSEKDSYQTLNTILSWEFRDRNNFNHKITGSAFLTGEKETFDIEGFYNMNVLDKNTGSENFSDTIMNIGLGSFLSHARNTLSARVKALGYRGDRKIGSVAFNWGIRLRNDRINDRLKEWTKTDSAGYSIPYNENQLLMSYLISAENEINTLQGEAYIESGKTVSTGYGEIYLSGGIRGTYNSITDEILVSPRISARLKTGSKLSFRLAGGIYYQPPFYRELRFPDGSLNENIRSQKSIHFVAGTTYDFKAWDRPFRLSAEIYNKTLSNIIPYKVDNVRIIYSGENSAEGFARGVDLRLNGEFVPGAESWVSMSVMSSKLRIPGEIDEYFPAPFDQTFSMNIFFQDYLPGNPTWRAHINIYYATGLPIVSPYNDRYDQYHRLPDYRRVDLGITKAIKSKNSSSASDGFLRYFEEITAGLEVFNLLDINNTVSYFWVKTVNNISGRSRQFAVPEYLTGRSLNIRIMATF